MSRIENLKDKINYNNELLSEWEDKHDIAENPNEKARCKNEIKRIKKRLEKYMNELNNQSGKVEVKTKERVEEKSKLWTIILVFFEIIGVIALIKAKSLGNVEIPYLPILFFIFLIPIVLTFARSKKNEIHNIFYYVLIIIISLTVSFMFTSTFFNFPKHLCEYPFIECKINSNTSKIKDTSKLIRRLGTPEMIKKILTNKIIYDRNKKVLKIALNDLSQEEIKILEKYNISRKNDNTVEQIVFVKSTDNKSLILTSQKTNIPIIVDSKNNIFNIGNDNIQKVSLSKKTISNINEHNDNYKNNNTDKNNIRSTDLKIIINNNYKRLSQWEKKRDLSDNPNEIARCNNEIKRIKNQIDKYKKELANI